MKTSQTCTPVESCFSVVALRFIEMVSWRQLYLCQYILTQTNDTNMKIYLFTLLCFVAYLPANAEDTDKKENMNNYKKDVTLWYEAFTKKDAALLDKILHETWVDIPSPPGTAPGPEGVKPLFARLTTTFPDLKLTIEDILQDGNKVVVRARMAGTQKEAFMDFPSKNRRIDIQVVDIHEFKDGRIIRTWHTED